MPFPTEVNAFQREVRSDERFVAGRNPQHGAIVADSSNHLGTPARLAADASDQRFFSEGQSGINIDEKRALPKSVR